MITVKSFTKMAVQLINGLLLTKTLLCTSDLCEALRASPVGLRRKGKEVDPCLQQHRRFPNQHSQVQPFLCLHIWVMGAHSIAPPICSGWGPSATICWGGCLSLLPGTFSESNSKLENTACTGPCKILFPVHNHLIPDQHWFLLSMNPPSLKVLVLSVGKEIYNINSKRLHKGYFPFFFFFSTASLPFFIFIRTWQS